ncbi:hypothetical protein TVAG_463100 [Trichomonas vaginalis G3]|uniref:Uncharacterized protein n=1 Tax=Trichomonas vaginalis (strain ATCC PRA-98 / G3) TaxID=412133 RepID=A2DM21_TRIV3|nr:hypothetical protein TVAGG3_1013490 [Trichomonas vaginalis G3]EAY18624.1 hypothetical protein TVAG_463100 [Trichomonas vaginalis G3]KAI5491664.1 hypothetical protein TVAGG3_1013490 [Trichomonas vaginalis G3]|eukprot:XP_001579610.1 hypothetical protein [Trichomonas vaginalis G3]
MLSKDILYDIFSSLSGCKIPSQSSEQILHSIEDQYKYLEIIHKENSVNEIVENYSFFQNCDGFFNRISSLCYNLIDSEHLSSKIIGITSLTKLFLQVPIQLASFNGFMNKIISTLKDKSMPLHLRIIASNCLFEIQKAHPELMKIKDNELFQIANDIPTQTFIPPILQSNNPDNPMLDSFVNQRFYALNPFEKLVFTPKIFYPENTIPNDPIQLNNFLEHKSINKSQALSILENPMSSFGLSTVIERSSQEFNFSAEELIHETDSVSTISLKSQLLPPTIDTILGSQILSNFSSHSSESTLVKSIFNLSLRFPPQDVVSFFQKFYPSSQALDAHWYNLFKHQNEATKNTLICFMAQYPSRKAFIKASIKFEPFYSVPAIYNIDKEDNDMCKLLSTPLKEGKALASIFAKEKLSNMPEVKDINEKIEPKDIEFVPDMFTIQNNEIHVYNQYSALVVLTIAAKRKLKEPIVGITVTASCPECFHADGSRTIPISDFSMPEEVAIEMIAKKAANTRMNFRVVFSTLSGETKYTIIEPINIQMFQLFSSSDADFLMACAGTQESRLFLQIKMNDLENLLRQTVFGVSLVNEGREMHCVVTTPDGQLIGLRFIQNGNGITVVMKANDISYVASIDSFLRIIHNIVNKN